MVLTFLNDFTKRTADLWKKKKFEFNKTLEVNVDKKNSLSWKATHTLVNNAASKSQVEVTQKEKGLGEMKFTLGSGQVMKWNCKSKDLVDNLAVEVELEGREKGKAQASYQQDQWAAKLEAKYGHCKQNKRAVSVDGQISFAWDNVTLGAQAVMNGDMNVKDYNLGVRFDQDKNRTYALKTKKEMKEVEVAFYYKVSDRAEIGTQVGVQMEGSNQITVQAGGNYDFDDKTKLRYSLDTKGSLGLAYEYKFSNRIQGFVGTKYNLTNQCVTDGFHYKLVFDC